MAKTLVIVESPAKAKTIKKYLGTGYDVLASKGHVKDLPKGKGAVDVEHDFLERYEVIEGKAKVLDELKDAAAKADAVLLATDPDREGEAIAFHIFEEIASPAKPISRVEFHEITKKGVEAGVGAPRELNRRLYDAQRARRVLDRIVGYDVSNLVWSKLFYGLSAGRVQSVALRLIVDREREIEAFVPEEYWNVGVTLRGQARIPFQAKLAGADGQKLPVTEGGTAAAVREDLETASYAVAKVTRREQRRNPPAPYKTSQLQQDATNTLHFGAKRTMQIAQGLYEGVDLGQDGGTVGLITYMRTDSTRVSDDAVKEVREYVRTKLGASLVPAQPNVYRTTKNAQDAHEAIRPTSVELTPELVRKHLKDEQYKLYKLIWNRFVASQMTPAVYDRTIVDLEAKPTRAGRAHAVYALRANGRVLKSSGWLQVFEDQKEFAGEDEPETPTEVRGQGPAEEDTEGLLPELEQGEALTLQEPSGVLTEQKFTQPPPRFNEGSLVRELEKRGIGRPSTYAEILSKVQARSYVDKVGSSALKPTELGAVVVDGLVRSSLDIMDPQFTAQMEQELDEVGSGNLERTTLLKRFHKRFIEQLNASKKLASWKPEPEPTEHKCPECGEVLFKKWGRRGWFLTCGGYPTCDYSRDLEGGGTQETDYLCDKCSKPMVIREGRYGTFLSCSGYPSCRNARPVPSGVACPQCGGELLEVRSRKKGGRTFYGCSNYAAAEKCDYKLWARPVPEPCPDCGAAFLTRSGGKKPTLLCVTKECGYKRELTEEEAAAPIAPPRTGEPIQLKPLPRSEAEADEEEGDGLAVEAPPKKVGTTRGAPPKKATKAKPAATAAKVVKVTTKTTKKTATKAAAKKAAPKATATKKSAPLKSAARRVKP